MPRKTPRSLVPVPDASGGAVALRERLLEKAQVTEDDQARLLKAALDKLESQLEASVVRRLTVGTGAGRSEVREYVDLDTNAQRAAAVELLSVVGAYPSKSIGGSGQTQVAVVVRIDPMLAPMAQAKVVEVQSK